MLLNIVKSKEMHLELMEVFIMDTGRYEGQLNISSMIITISGWKQEHDRLVLLKVPTKKSVSMKMRFMKKDVHAQYVYFYRTTFCD